MQVAISKCVKNFTMANKALVVRRYILKIINLAAMLVELIHVANGLGFRSINGTC